MSVHKRPTRRTLQSFRGEFTDVLECQDIVDIDAGGIYINAAGSILEHYSHDYKRIAQYSHAAEKMLYSISTAGKLMCAANDMLYLIDSDKQRLYLPPHDIYDVKYHPIRQTYLISHLDYITEVDEQLQHAIYLPRIPQQPLTLLPSDTSSMTYINWQSVIGPRLGIIDSDMTVTHYGLGRDRLCNTLMARPGHPDVLTLVYDHHVDVLDLWHSSATACSIAQLTFNYIRCGVHLDANICITMNGYYLYATDLRYGTARKWRNLHKSYSWLANIWYAASRIYVSSMENLYVFD